MKKIYTLISLFILLSVSFVQINAQSLVGTRNIAPNPCDDILLVGEYVMFDHPASEGAWFRVDKIDVVNDKVYNSKLKAWLPAYALTEVNENGLPVPGLDDILYVGEYFRINVAYAQAKPFCFYIYDIDIPNNMVKLKFKKSSTSYEYVWVSAAPLHEADPSAPYGYCS